MTKKDLHEQNEQRKDVKERNNELGDREEELGEEIQTATRRETMEVSTKTSLQITNNRYYDRTSDERRRE